MTLTAYLSKVLKKKPEELKVYVHQYLVGGGFGGKQDYDDILAAAYCVKEIGRPVKLIHTRETNFATSFRAHAHLSHSSRPASRTANCVAMNQDIVCGWMGARFSRRQEVRLRLAAARLLGRQEAGHRPVVHRRQRSLVLRARTIACAPGTSEPHHLGGAGERTAHRVQLLQHLRRRVVHGRGGACRRARSARVPAVDAERQGRQPRHSQHRLSRRARRPTTTWTSCGSRCRGPRRVPGRPTSRQRWAVRCGWRTACGSRPAKSGYGTKKLAAEHRHWHRGDGCGRTPESDLGRRRRRSHRRSEDRQVQHQPAHDRDGSGYRHQPEQRQGADPGFGAVGRKPDHVRAPDATRTARSSRPTSTSTCRSGWREVPEIDVDDHRVRAPSVRRRRARFDRRRAGGGQRHLQRRGRARAAHAHLARGGAGGDEDKKA